MTKVKKKKLLQEIKDIRETKNIWIIFETGSNKKKKKFHFLR